MKARLAFSKRHNYDGGIIVNFTPRGRQVEGSVYTNGFIRLNGKTIGGYVYDGGTELVFYTNQNGINAHITKAALDTLPLLGRTA